MHDYWNISSSKRSKQWDSSDQIIMIMKTDRAGEA